MRHPQSWDCKHSCFHSPIVKQLCHRQSCRSTCCLNPGTYVWGKGRNTYEKQQGASAEEVVFSWTKPTEQQQKQSSKRSVALRNSESRSHTKAHCFAFAWQHCKCIFFLFASQRHKTTCRQTYGLQNVNIYQKNIHFWNINTSKSSGYTYK